jgi:predicted AAA+ superfamily ATPase
MNDKNERCPSGIVRQSTENTIEEVLAERGKRYGNFKDHANICQDIKRTMQATRSWKVCSDSQRQALEVIADKIARSLNGDPNYEDNWVDIIGYAQLVLDQLRKR